MSKKKPIKSMRKKAAIRLQESLVRGVRSCSSRYIVWRLDRGWPVTGSGLRFIERKLYAAASRCREAEQKSVSTCRIFAIGR